MQKLLFLFISLCLSFPFTVHASDQASRCPEASPQKIQKTIRSHNPSKITEESEMFNLTVRFTYTDEYTPVAVRYGGLGGGQQFDYEGQDEMEIFIETQFLFPDILIAEFRKEGEKDCQYLVIKEFDGLYDEMTVEFNVAEASDEYCVNFLQPDGQPFDAYDDPEQADDYYVFGSTYLIYNKGHVKQLMFNRDFMDMVDPSWDADWTHITYPRLYTNKLPDGMCFVGNMLASSILRQEFYMVQTDPITAAGTATNRPELYVKGDYGIMPNKAMFEAEDLVTIRPSILMSVGGWICETKTLGGVRTNDVGEQGVSRTTQFCLPVSDSGTEPEVQSLAEFILQGASQDETIDSWLMLPEEGELHMLPFNISIGGAAAIPDDMFTREFDNWIQSDYRKFVNPHLPTLKSSYTTVPGNSVPSLVFCAQSGEGEIPAEYFPNMFQIGWFDFGFVGRCGEAQMMDKDLATLTGSRDGDTYTYTIKSNNTLIDGKIPGGSTTTLLCQMKEYDFAPPTVQQILFTNNNGDVTDRFADAAEANINFYAGDFYWEISEDFTLDQMNVRPLESVTVETAPHKSENYVPVDVTEDPDRFFMPGYGYWFEGSLANVKETGEGGWCDIRITLTDTSGNVMTQTISPAFCLTGNASLHDVTGNNADAPCEYFNLNGVRITEPS